MKEKIPFYNEKEFHDMVKKTKKGTFSGWYIIDKDNNSVEFSGKFNRQFKLNKPVIPVNTEYVTRKEFNEYKNSNDQRLTKIETTLAAQGEQINKLTQTVEKQGEQIKELQIEQKAQGETLKLILQTLQKMSDRLDKMEVKMDKMEVKMDKMEKRIDKLESK
ncbi:DUF16 domain-containing protein [Mycoplasmoides pneumoniae]|uniref:DUF16 domain-containing protein n=1 Tax=Mycoplasmoides pneumoniae TaxID=2104 RepID=UPI00071B8DEE|nr:DUF16 domain-containing protein [Mycoplasmoides pneumoniae]